MSPVLRRQGIALLALAGLFVSIYLLLYSLGIYGSLACGVGGGCSTVQASTYSRFMGLPVAGWGVGWYVAVLVTAFASLHATVGRSRAVGALLFLLAMSGLLFSAYLTYLEAFVIGAWCRWCVGSAIITVLIFLLAVPEARWLKPAPTKVPAPEH